MTNDQFDTPVLYLVFNRPEHTRRSFETIRAIRPKRLFIAADGPREHVTADLQTTREVRRIVMTVDWPCEIKTLFRERNLGSALSVSNAVSWFFSNVEEGIILEDDCIPHPDFWAYCQTFLRHYADNDKIMAICGANFQGPSRQSDESHYLSKYPHCWGWASWRRAWAHYNHDLVFDKNKVLKALITNFWTNPFAIFYWLEIMKNLRKAKWDAWDYRWYLSVWASGGLAALPSKNLVKNIGFDKDATHTKDSENSLKASLEVSPIKHVLEKLNGHRSLANDIYYEYKHLIWPECLRFIKRYSGK